jgi:hypothetical protein
MSLQKVSFDRSFSKKHEGVFVLDSASMTQCVWNKRRFSRLIVPAVDVGACISRNTRFF